MNEKKCIIFDMDGTLIDSSEAMTGSVNFVRQTLGLEPIEKAFLEYHINQPDQHLPKIFYNTSEYDPAHRELFKEHYLKFSPQMISLYPHVREMLTFLSQNATLCIATNASDFFARNMLEHLNILNFFAHIVGANNVKEAKPNPEMINSLLDATSSSKEQTILIGDSIKDELAAHNANIQFIFANWGYGTSETATVKAKDIRELLGLFKNL
ncbi:MAG: HAD family hydrolase [Campylobacteraceae bacterium]|nr:HAD family hydrolase [Campylobacteraceae bacterium]